MYSGPYNLGFPLVGTQKRGLSEGTYSPLLRYQQETVIGHCFGHNVKLKEVVNDWFCTQSNNIYDGIRKHMDNWTKC